MYNKLLEHGLKELKDNKEYIIDLINKGKIKNIEDISPVVFEKAKIFGGFGYNSKEAEEEILKVYRLKRILYYVEVLKEKHIRRLHLKLCIKEFEDLLLDIYCYNDTEIDEEKDTEEEILTKTIEIALRELY